MNSNKTIKVLPSGRVQLVTRLISSDSDHQDELNYLLMALDGGTVTKILDTHKRFFSLFPEALEVVLEDRENSTQFITGDDDQYTMLATGTDYRVINDEREFFELTEDDNDHDAEIVDLCKIVIREEDVRIVGVYEYSDYLRNAFTASPMLPISFFENVLRALQFQERRRIPGDYVAYDEFGAFYRAVDSNTLLVVPMLADGEPDLDENDQYNASEIDFSVFEEADQAECRQILAELLANWKDIAIPQFVLDMVENGEAVQNFKNDPQSVAWFNLNAHDGTKIELSIHPKDREQREYSHYSRFYFINPNTNQDGETPMEFDDEIKAEEYASNAVYGLR